MIVKALGLFDMLAATILIFGTHAPERLMLYVAVYLIVKGALFAFTGDIISVADIIIGGYAILIMNGHAWTLLTVISVLFLYQKGILSFI